MMYSYRSRFVFSVLVILLSLSFAVAALNGTSSSHSEPAQRMFEDFNEAFIRHWKTRTGIQVTIRQAQTNSGVPIRAAVDGLDAIWPPLLPSEGPEMCCWHGRMKLICLSGTGARTGSKS